MADWKDFAVVLCLSMVILGAAALVVASQSFTVVEGRVTEKGVALGRDADGRIYVTKTVSVLIENDDRVFKIKRGTVVTYPVSDLDSDMINVGSEIQLLVSSSQSQARVVH